MSTNVGQHQFSVLQTTRTLPASPFTPSPPHPPHFPTTLRSQPAGRSVNAAPLQCGSRSSFDTRKTIMLINILPDAGWPAGRRHARVRGFVGRSAAAGRPATVRGPTTSRRRERISDGRADGRRRTAAGVGHEFSNSRGGRQQPALLAGKPRERQPPLCLHALRPLLATATLPTGSAAN